MDPPRWRHGPDGYDRITVEAVYPNDSSGNIVDIDELMRIAEVAAQYAVDVAREAMYDRPF